MKANTRSWRRAALCLLLACWASAAQAHKGSDAYLEVQNVGAQGSGRLHFALSVAVKDLDLVLPLDANGDAKVTWGEIRAAVPSMEALLNQTVTLENGSAPATAKPDCHLSWFMAGLESRGDGSYVQMVADPICGPGQPIALRYRLLREQDASHRLMVAGRLDGVELLMSISPGRDSATLLRAGSAPTGSVSAPLAAPHGAWSTAWRYLLVGTEHLLEGYDHLAFLLALLLPLQLRLPLGRIFPMPVLRVRQVQFAGISAAPTSASPPAPVQSAPWFMLLRTVTAFTLGHSITLALATLGYTSAASSWVEPAIAASIGATALLNLYPRHWARTDVLAGAFGLIHGYGFAGLLIDGGAPPGLLGWALGGFNVGVEVGQLIAVGAWLLLSRVAMEARWYRQVIVRGGSWALLALSAYWFIERVG